MYFVMDICCLCLTKNDITQNLINIDEKNENKTYHQKITTYFPELDFGESFDDYKLCTKCCNTINLLYDFKNKCITSLNVFKSYRSNLCAISKANNDEILPNKTQTSTNLPIGNEIDNNVDVLNGIVQPRVNQNEFDEISNDSKNSDITRTISEVLISDLSDRALSLGTETIETDPINTKKFECTVCHKKFLYHSALLKHVKSHKLIYDATEEKNQQSPAKNAYDIEELEVSTSTGTVDIDKPYHCQICTRKFTQFSSLISHQKIHNSDQIGSSNSKSLPNSPKKTEERIFTCKICNKTFSKRKSLLDHKEVHTIEKPFECEICHEKFDSYTILIKHRKNHL